MWWASSSSYGAGDAEGPGAGGSGSQDRADEVRDDGRFASLEFDPYGYAHVASFDVTNQALKYIYEDVDGWHDPAVLDGQNAGLYTDIALASGGRPIVAYYQGEPTYGSCYIMKEWNGTWRKQCHIDVAPPEYGAYIQVEVQSSQFPAPNSLPIVGYQDGTMHAALFWWEEGIGFLPHYGSAFEFGNPTGLEPGLYLSMDMDQDGNPTASYYEANNRCLKFASRIPSSPYFEYEQDTVDCEGGDVGLYASLVMATGAQPHISYYDAANTRLKYAYRISSLWVTETIDDAGDVGQYSSIDVSPIDGMAHIAYYDATNGRLKYAHQEMVERVFLPVVLRAR